MSHDKHTHADEQASTDAARERANANPEADLVSASETGKPERGDTGVMD